jgi:hypothetical protein
MNGINEKTVPKTVCLTARDIEHGVRGSCVMCPVAMAVSRLLHNRFYVTVRSVITFRRGNPHHDDWDTASDWEAAAAMPIDMVFWINGFDADKSSSKPAQFVVWIPERLLAFKDYEVT